MAKKKKRVYNYHRESLKLAVRKVNGGFIVHDRFEFFVKDGFTVEYEVFVPFKSRKRLRVEWIAPVFYKNTDCDEVERMENALDDERQFAESEAAEAAFELVEEYLEEFYPKESLGKIRYNPLVCSNLMARRPLYQIAREIVSDWRQPYFGAVPYLQAMLQLESIKSKYGMDDADTIVLYFLANAATWRGETAKRIKAELKSMLKDR